MLYTAGVHLEDIPEKENYGHNEKDQWLPTAGGAWGWREMNMQITEDLQGSENALYYSIMMVHVIKYWPNPQINGDHDVLK